MQREDVKALRPEALTHIRDGIESLETGLLADGRQWVLKTEKPSLADIQGLSHPSLSIAQEILILTRVPDAAIWPFHWLLEINGALPPSLVSKEIFPKVYAWVDRFSKAVSTAMSSAPKSTTLEGAEAVRYVTQANFSEPEGDVDANDPLGLKKGQDIESWPIDSGFKNHDRGRLVSLTSKEVVLASQSKFGGKEVRIHHPRWNFRIRAVSGEGARL